MLGKVLSLLLVFNLFSQGRPCYHVIDEKSREEPHKLYLVI